MCLTKSMRIQERMQTQTWSHWNWLNIRQWIFFIYRAYTGWLMKRNKEWNVPLKPVQMQSFIFFQQDLPSLLNGTSLTGDSIRCSGIGNLNNVLIFVVGHGVSGFYWIFYWWISLNMNSLLACQKKKEVWLSVGRSKPIGKNLSWWPDGTYCILHVETYVKQILNGFDAKHTRMCIYFPPKRWTSMALLEHGPGTTHISYHIEYHCVLQRCLTF